jgi:hypothetical protein
VRGPGYGGGVYADDTTTRGVDSSDIIDNNFALTSGDNLYQEP